MKYLLWVLSLQNLLFCNSLDAQVAPSIEWQKCLGGSKHDLAYSIQQTTDGGFIIAGASESSDGDATVNNEGYDYWIVKLDAGGNLVWQKSLGGNDYDIAYSVQQTTDGGFIVAGESLSNDDDVSGNHGDDDAWIVKLDADGNLIWQKCYGGSYGEQAQSIQQITDGGFIVAGNATSNDGDVSGNHGGGGDYWVVKLDSGGNIIWQKCLGGSGIDYATSVEQTTDGGFIVGGNSNSTNGDVSGNHYGEDCWIVKLDANGNLVWQKSFGGIDDEDARSIQQTTDNGFIVAGHTYSNDGDVVGKHGYSDYWVVKLDAAGNLIWQKPLGGYGWDDAVCIKQTNDGGFVVAGTTSSNDGDVSGNHGGGDAWIVNLDMNGNLVWQKSLGGSAYEAANSIQQTMDNGFIVAGTSSSADGNVSGWHEGFDNYNSLPDYWIVKLSSDTTSGIVSSPTNFISLYPNPFTTHLQIHYTITQHGELRMYDALGRKVKSCVLPSSQKTFEFSVAELPAGIYLIAVNSGGQTFTEKVVKE